MTSSRFLLASVACVALAVLGMRIVQSSPWLDKPVIQELDLVLFDRNSNVKIECIVRERLDKPNQWSLTINAWSMTPATDLECRPGERYPDMFGGGPGEYDALAIDKVMFRYDDTARFSGEPTEMPDGRIVHSLVLEEYDEDCWCHASRMHLAVVNEKGCELYTLRGALEDAIFAR